MKLKPPLLSNAELGRWSVRWFLVNVAMCWLSLLSLLIDSTLLHIVSILVKDSWICPCSQEHHSCFCRVDVCGRCFHIQCISPSLCLIRVWEPLIWVCNVMFGKLPTYCRMKCLGVSLFCLYKRKIEKASLFCVYCWEWTLQPQTLFFHPAPTISALLQNLLLSP